MEQRQELSPLWIDAPIQRPIPSADLVAALSDEFGEDMSLPTLEQTVAEIEDRPFECLRVLIAMLVDELDFLDKSPFIQECSANRGSDAGSQPRFALIVVRDAYRQTLSEMIEAVMAEYSKPIERAFYLAQSWAVDAIENERAIALLRTTNDCITDLLSCRDVKWERALPRIVGFEDAERRWRATEERLKEVARLIEEGGEVLSVREMQLGHLPRRILAEIAGRCRKGPEIAKALRKEYDSNFRKALLQLKKGGFIENIRGRGYRRVPRVSLQW